MQTKLDVLTFGPLDLTGNSGLVRTPTTVYVFAGNRSDNKFVVYKSVDNGRNFAESASLTLTANDKLSEPAVYFKSSNGIIYGVVSVANIADTTTQDLRYFKYDTADDSLLLGSTVLLTASKIHSAYDIVVLNGTIVVVVAAVEATIGATSYPGYQLLSIEMTYLGAVEDTPTSVSLYSTPSLRSGDAKGSVSLWTPDELSLELYNTSHAKTFEVGKKRPIIIETRNRTGVDTWGAASLLANYSADFTDDKLTVVGVETPSPTRLLSNSYRIRKTDGSTRTCIIYGVGLNGNYSFLEISDTSKNLSEPVPQIDVNGIGRLTYLEDGFLRSYYLTDFSSGTLVEESNYPRSSQYSFLRGSDTYPDAVSKFQTVGYTVSGSSAFIPSYVSGLNLPPVIGLSVSPLTVTRGVPIIFDASSTFDPDSDPVTISWSIDDASTGVDFVVASDTKSATLTVQKSVGPAARTINVTVHATDNINPTEDLVSVVNVPVDTAPTISITPNTINANRNETITITAVGTDAETQSTLDYQWSQLTGSPVVLQDTDKATVTLTLVGVDINGETLTFRASVSDGVNSPVTADVSVIIPSIAYSLTDTKTLHTSAFVGGIAGRNDNTTSNWASETVSGDISDFNKDVRRSRTLNNQQRLLFVSSASATVVDFLDLGGGTPTPSLYRKYISPLGEVLDAIHCENDSTILLTRTQNLDLSYNYFLLKYTTASTNEITDSPENILDLGAISPFGYSGIEVTGSYSGVRILFLYGSENVLAAELKDSSFEILSSKNFRMENNTLVGSDLTLKLRHSGVESMSSGVIFVLTKNNTSGDYFETLIDMGTNHIIDSWDKGKTPFAKVNTLEIVSAENINAYLGFPSAPTDFTLTILSNVGGTFNLQFTWTQKRPDVIKRYELEQSYDGSSFTILANIPSGAIREYFTTAILPHNYTYRIRAVNDDGASAYSPELHLYTVSPYDPVGFGTTYGYLYGLAAD